MVERAAVGEAKRITLFRPDEVNWYDGRRGEGRELPQALTQPGLVEGGPQIAGDQLNVAVVLVERAPPFGIDRPL